MSTALQRLEQTELSELATTIRNAGIAGAGGAGFPSYAKWDRLEEVDYLLMNHQESEPNYYIDKWLGEEHVHKFASLFDVLLERGAFEAIVIGAKEKDRDEWMTEFEDVTEATVLLPDDLPMDASEQSGVICAYTQDKYEYGMESVLLRMVVDVVIGKNLPVDHGWIVQNTETLYNIYRTFESGAPMISKYLHVGGNVPRHRFLEVPVGTPASSLLEAAGRSPATPGADEMLTDGGPGWCFEIEEAADEFGVTKRSNCVLVLDADVAEENTLGNDRINVINAHEWDDDHETEPTATLVPEYVRVPLITNPAFEGVVSAARPIVSPGDRVSKGEMIATPSADGISVAHHASIEGKVEDVTDTHVEIRRETDIEATAERQTVDTDRLLYWTWCRECGSYVVTPNWEDPSSPTEYVCEDCR